MKSSSQQVLSKEYSPEEYHPKNIARKNITRKNITQRVSESITRSESLEEYRSQRLNF